MVCKVAERVQRKSVLYHLRSKWDLHSVGELVLCMGDFNGHVGKRIEGYEGVHGRNGIGEINVEGDAIWFYARQRNDRCSLHSEEAARQILRQGEKVVYVLR